VKFEILLNNILKKPFRTSQETHYVSAAKTKCLMLFMETIVYYDKHEHTDILCEQNHSFIGLKQVVHFLTNRLQRVKPYRKIQRWITVGKKSLIFYEYLK
jgi:hypothetical protein